MHIFAGWMVGKDLPLLSIFLASQASFSEKHASDIMTKKS
jgi:hypothetical protein